MEGGEHCLPSSAPAGDTTVSPPPLGDPVTATDLAALSDHVPEPEILAIISDEEHDHEHDLDHDHDPEHEHEDDHHDDDHDRDHAVVTAVSLDDLKLKIIKQVEYYLSDENLPNDKYLLGFVKRNKEGFVPISLIASFRKMKKLTRDHSIIVAALKESSMLVVSGDGKRVKRLNPLRFNEFKDHKLYTVLVENLPENHSKENIHQIFREAGNIKRITIHDPRSAAESAKHTKQEIFISNKLHAFVEYETIEAAEKAVEMLNDEQDWRNGMRVKLLKRLGKYGHKKQAWKVSNPEKNNSSHSEKSNSSHVSEQTVDEENHGSNEHHEDTHEEEDVEHLSKDKGGHRYRNQGRSRKHKYRATNGMGHGNTSSTHAPEVSKPPPGPKMPDGTRGFAIGRGRPPVPASI